MSTFLGLIKEIPGISVDHFCGENLNSSLYFLSHCHTDHMRGLDDKFIQYLESTDKYLYCSPLSKILLESHFNQTELRRIKELDIDANITIVYNVGNSDMSISVTCIAAGHCPGSIMFLFEYNAQSILYTGDFRIYPKDLPKLKSLHHTQGHKQFAKKFTKIYLDTTFLDSDFDYLPTRQESLTEIHNVIKEWLQQDLENVVVLECSANYGSEFLYVELAKSLNSKIHVKDKVYPSYCRVIELAPYITNNPLITPIHACMNKMSRSYLKCRSEVQVKNILTIVPSVMKWRGKDTSKVVEWDKVRERTVNVCYSMHSSLRELQAFLQYFEAEEIFPCVCDESKQREVFALLDDIRKKPLGDTIVENETYELKLPDYKKSYKMTLKSAYCSDDDDF